MIIFNANGEKEFCPILSRINYIVRDCSSMAIGTCRDKDTLHLGSSLLLDNNLFLLSWITLNLGQCALLRCEHPSAKILFLSKYLIQTYQDQYAAIVASAFSEGVSILSHQYRFRLNIETFILRKIFFKFGQFAFLRCEHPSAPNLLSA